jgi:hypothetical protein
MNETPMLSANKFSVVRTIGQLVRTLWSRAVPPVDESPPIDGAPPVGGSPPVDESPAAEAGEIAIEQPADIEDAPVPEPADELAGPARFEWRVLWAPKGGNDDKEWEDGYAQNAGGGVVALADGAGDGIYSKLWADLLLKSFVAKPIRLEDLTVVEPWIQEQRRAWLREIRYSEQRWSIQMKIDRSCGAATFVALKLDSVPAGEDAENDTTGWTAWAVGDACLFHIRGDQLIASFPVNASSDFGIAPLLYQSKAMRATPLAVVTRGELMPDDLIVLATDATAQRLMAEIEAGTPPDWGRFWDLDQETWRAEIAALREQNAIVNDDCTLLVLRLPVADPVSPDGLTTAIEADETNGREPIEECGGIDSAIAAALEPTGGTLEPTFANASAIEDQRQRAGVIPDGSVNEPDRSSEDCHA